MGVNNHVHPMEAPRRHAGRDGRDWRNATERIGATLLSRGMTVVAPTPGQHSGRRLWLLPMVACPPGRTLCARVQCRGKAAGGHGRADARRSARPARRGSRLGRRQLPLPDVVLEIEGGVVDPVRDSRARSGTSLSRQRNGGSSGAARRSCSAHRPARAARSASYSGQGSRVPRNSQTGAVSPEPGTARRDRSAPASLHRAGASNPARRAGRGARPESPPGRRDTSRHPGVRGAGKVAWPPGAVQTPRP